MMKAERLSNFNALFEVLGEDATHAFEQLESDPSPRCRRSVFRTVFSSIEATTQAIKQLVIPDLEDHPEKYSDAEAAMIREETYDLDSQSKARARLKILQTDANFRFAISMLVRGVRESAIFDAGGDGWRSLRESLRVRNRVTHPRLAQDVDVSSGEVDTLRIAYEFVRTTTTRNMASVVLGLREQRYEILNQVLASDVLDWLDGLQSIGDGEVLVPAHWAKILVDTGVADSRGGEAVLGFYGVEYLKWRRHGCEE